MPRAALSLPRCSGPSTCWTPGQAPEPSAYFDQKLAVLLREEQAKPAAGWLERMRERLLFNTGRQFRPMLAGALALLVVLGGGTFAGITEFSQVSQPTPATVTASATVDDLQILDRNEQAIQQMDQLLQDDDRNDSNAAPAATGELGLCSTFVLTDFCFDCF